MIPENTLVMLYSLTDQKKFFIRTEKGKNFSSHLGTLPHEEILSHSFGEKTATHLGREFLLIRPSLYDIIMNINRHTQIIYPKDIGYILLKLGVRNGDRIIEAGTGSGSLTIGLAYAAAPEGRIYTYERQEEFSRRAEKNLEMAGIREYVEMKVRDVEQEGFDESQADAVFLDMKEPYGVLEHAFSALRPGGTLGLLLPTVNQISDTLKKMENMDFVETEVTEIFIRHYKINADRLRPNDIMVGHTGYLVFSRRGMKGVKPSGGEG